MDQSLNQVVNPGIWAQAGGLNGLVIFALFLALFAFAYTIYKLSEKHAFSISAILDRHREDMSKVMDLHASEREKWGEITDARAAETNAAINALSKAVNRMAVRHRFDDKDDG